MNTVYFLCGLQAMLLSAMLFASGAATKLISNYKNQSDEIAKLEQTITNLTQKMQNLTKAEVDVPQNKTLFSIEEDFCDYKVCFYDCSTALNPKILSKSFYNHEAIQKLVRFYKEEIITEYGFLNPHISEKKVLTKIAEDFLEKPFSDPEAELFPLICELPPFNVCSMSADFLEAVLIACNIPNPKQKALSVQELLQTEQVSQKNLQKALGVKSDHIVLKYLGTKTVFWKANLCTKRFTAEAIFAAIPEPGKSTVSEYRLVSCKIEPRFGPKEDSV